MKRRVNSISVGHIGLNVSDLDVSEAFYQEVLGLRVAQESLHFPFRYASMERDGQVVLTLWEQTGGRYKKRRPGLNHLAFEVDSKEEVNRTRGILENLGATWTKGSHQHQLYPEGSAPVALRFKDPDGILIEIYVAEPVRANCRKSIACDIPAAASVAYAQ
jgi:lactoylglutathione lyase